MSNPTDKNIKSLRRYNTENVIAKRLKEAKNLGVDISKIFYEKHRYYKKNPLDCGNARCVLCSSPRKVSGLESKQERSHKQEIIHRE